MFAVYETVDLGIVSMLIKIDPSLLDILQGNHPVFVPDPIHGDSLYLYHAFGVQALNFRALLESLAIALQDESDDKDGALREELKKEQGVEVTPILSTFSVERRSVCLQWTRSCSAERALDLQIQWYHSQSRTTFICPTAFLC